MGQEHRQDPCLGYHKSAEYQPGLGRGWGSSPKAVGSLFLMDVGQGPQLLEGSYHPPPHVVLSTMWHFATSRPTEGRLFVFDF